MYLSIQSFPQIIEFLDTFFFVLRKKNEHISFLHVFHHFAVPLSLWFAIKMAPGGHGIFFATCNSLVHAVMYLYYGLAAVIWQPHMRTKYLWWKVWLTRMQILQFVVVCLHSTQLLLDNSCQYPIVFTYILNFYSLLFFLLFADYYRKAYIKSRGKMASSAKGKKDSKYSMNWTGVSASRLFKSN